MVIGYHAGLPFPARLGVSMFFVISGFLITWLLLKEFEGTGGINLRGFYLRRTLRIFPAYYLFLGVSLVLDRLTGDERSTDAIAPALLYLMNYYNAVNDHPSISIAHAWSLAIEEQFYLLWPFLLLLLGPARRRVIALSLVAFVTVVLCWRSFVHLETDLGPAWIYNAFDTRADNLAIGCLLAILATSGSIDRFVERITGSAIAPIVVVAGLAGWTIIAGPNWRYTLGLTLEPILLALLMLQLIVLSSRAPWSVIEMAPVRYIGRISYGMYLYHVLGFAVAGKLLGWLMYEGRLAKLILGTVVTILGAALSFAIVEQPLMRLKGRIASARERPSAQDLRP
jgi:peptidoglycan/LPS O-acetylase OafA/YrhL